MTCGPAIPPSATCCRACKGRLKLEYASFQAHDDPALKLVIYTAG